MPGYDRSVVRKMSIGENYVGKLTPMRSNISRFSRGTVCLSKFPTTDRGSPSERRGSAERSGNLGWKCGAEMKRNE